jgi:protein TonB
MLEVLVSAEGRVSELRLVESSGHASLDRAALRSVKKWVFTPGTKGMKKVEMWVRVPVVFQLK